MLKRTIEKYVLPAAAAAAAPAASGTAGTTAAAGGAAGGGGGAAGGAARAGAAGEVAKGMPKGGAGMDPGSAIRQAGAQTAGFVNAFSSIPDSAGGRYRADLERVKAQKYAAKHPSWSVPFSTKERTSPGLAAHSFASHEGFGGRAAMLLSDLAAGIHERSPSTPLADAVHQAAKDMVAKGVASPDVASFAQHGPSSIGREKFGASSAEYPLHPSMQHPGGNSLGGRPSSGM